jgi:hypothetical protein
MSKGMRINLKVDVHKLTMDDFIALNKARGSVFQAELIRDLISRFVVGKSGEDVSPEEATKQAGSLTIDELQEVIKFIIKARS